MFVQWVVTCDQYIYTILVQILEMCLVEIGQVFPQSLYSPRKSVGQSGPLEK